MGGEPYSALAVMAALARIPVLPETSSLGALSAQLSRSGRHPLCLPKALSHLARRGFIAASYRLPKPLKSIKFEFGREASNEQ